MEDIIFVCSSSHYRGRESNKHHGSCSIGCHDEAQRIASEMKLPVLSPSAALLETVFDGMYQRQCLGPWSCNQRVKRCRGGARGDRLYQELAAPSQGPLLRCRIRWWTTLQASSCSARGS
eukprot:1847709-Amphidinium_carterae.2